ncbi:MAG: glycosyltransferase family 1 protein [Pseudomonadota bacterium]|nr:glycosyltransferase family 1 protein [Pseudomonadota bacterium]
MPGGGIKLGTIANKAPSNRVLDLTRLASRAGRKATGIDRVELAYLRALLDRDTECYGLVRVALGYVLLDRAGMQSFLHRYEGRTPWGNPRFVMRFFSRLDPLQKRVHSDLWRLAAVRVYGKKLPRLLNALTGEFTYLNVGHSNLTEATLAPMAAKPGTKITVMLHDTIPLDHPEYCRAGSVEKFHGMLRRVMDHAELVICNSDKTRSDVVRHMAALNEEREEEARVTPPNCIIARLGTDMIRADDTALPIELPQDRPLFLAVGTIEPRKNHALLLDVWENWNEDEDGPRPVLGICGSRGWMNEDLFRRLDRTPLRGRDVFEWPNLPDKSIAALMGRAHALLFPSLAEGHGFPPVEAAMLGTPVISADLAAVRETLGDLPVYLDGTDRYSWAKAVKSRIEEGRSGTGASAGFFPPTWDEHFNVVLKMT